MLTNPLSSAIIINPFVAFTLDPSRKAEDIEYTAQVYSMQPEQAKFHVLNGEFNVTVDEKGIVTESDNPAWIGKACFIQWQGREPKAHPFIDDFYVMMADVARHEVQAGRPGPHTLADLQALTGMRNLTLVRAADRLRLLGDSRLSNFLAHTYPAYAAG